MKWRMIGPDGIPDRPEPYDTATDAARALIAFQQRFVHQGYYDRADGTKLSLSEIPNNCQIEPVADTPAEDRCDPLNGRFKVWVQIECVNDDKGEYDNTSEEELLAEFKTQAQAESFVEWLVACPITPHRHLKGEQFDAS